MIKHLVEKLLVMVLFLSLGVVSVETVEASQWKLSHEVELSKTRKLCVYIKDGSTKSIEQAKNQYCRTYL